MKLVRKEGVFTSMPQYHNNYEQHTRKLSRLSIADESLSLEDTTPETPQTGGNRLSSSMDDPVGI